MATLWMLIPGILFLHHLRAPRGQVPNTRTYQTSVYVMFTSVQLTMASHLAKPKAMWEDMDTHEWLPT